MRVCGYVRVSTADQSYEAQGDQIRSYCMVKGFELVQIFADKSSGKSQNRTGFQELVSVLETNSWAIETIIVTNLDRIGRSLRDLLQFIDWCAHKNINIISITNNIDTTSTGGRLFLHMMGALSEYERELIRERTAQGRKTYLQHGGKLGRTPKPVDLDLARRLIAEGVPKSVVARKLKISRETLYNRLADNTNSPPGQKSLVELAEKRDF